MAEDLALADFGGAFIGGEKFRAADGRWRMAGSGYLSWFRPRKAHPVSITCIHGGGGQSTDFIATPDGRPGWLRAFLKAGYPVFLLDRPGHGRARWDAEALGPRLPAPDYETMEARFLRPAGGRLWPEAPGADDAFMASQDGPAASLAAAQRHAEAIAPALFDRTGPTILLTHSAGGPCGWAMAAFGGEALRGVVACEPQGAPGATHPLGVFAQDLTAAPLAGPEDPFRAPVAVVTSEAGWMRESNARIVEWLELRGADVTHFKLEAHGLGGGGHMMMLETNSDGVAALLLDWIARKAARS